MTPQKIIVADRAGFLWRVHIHGVEHHLAWWPSSGQLLVSWQTDERGTQSPFVHMGDRYSPQWSLSDAADAVEQWAGDQARAMTA